MLRPGDHARRATLPPDHQARNIAIGFVGAVATGIAGNSSQGLGTEAR